MATIDASKIHHNHVPTVITDIISCHGQDVKVDRPPPPLIPIADSTATVRLMRPAQQPSTERPRRSSKGRLRKKRRLLKEREKESTFPNRLENDTDELLPSCHKQPQTSIHASLPNVSDGHSQLSQVSGNPNGEPILLKVDEVDISRENNHNKTVTAPGEGAIPALQFSAGVRTQRVCHLMIVSPGVNLAF